MVEQLEFRFVTADEWSAFLGTSHQASPFVEPWFLDCYGYDITYLLVFRHGRPVSGVALHDSSGVTPPFSMYHGLLLSRETVRERRHLDPGQLDVVQDTLSFLTREFRALSMNFHWRFPDFRPLSWLSEAFPPQSGVRIQLHHSAVISLQGAVSFEAIASRIRKTRMHEITKSRKRLSVTSDGDLLSCIALSQHSLERQGVPYNESRLELIGRITQAAISQGKGKVFQAKDQGKILASIFVIYDDESAYYLLSGSTDEGRRLGANSLLVYEALLWAWENDIPYWDFVGANSPHRGAYKLSFGARLVLSPTLQIVPSTSSSSLQANPGQEVDQGQCVDSRGMDAQVGATGEEAP